MLEKLKKFEIENPQLINGGGDEIVVCNSDGSMTMYFANGTSITWWPSTWILQ